MTGCAWLWLYAGIFLMLSELLAPGFIMCFFGLSAMSVGLLRFVFGEAFTLPMQWAAFSALSILYLVFLRRMLKGVFRGEREVSGTDFERESVGRVGKVTAAIEPPRTGRVMIGDAEWTASADAPLAVGTDVKVISQDNLTMKVEVI